MESLLLLSLNSDLNLEVAEVSHQQTLHVCLSQVLQTYAGKVH